ncbi:MAG: BON domain-containing protein [Gaiellaceae bacterium]
MRSIRSFPLFAAIGAGLAYFFDPQSGKRRRKMTLDRVAGFFRRGGKRAERASRAVASEAYGLKQKATHRREEEKPQPDDATLARKVESEIFRDSDLPKGQINVNAERGVVYLRGEVERPELIADLEQAARKVQGVQEVENFLHLPGAEPQMKQ